MDHDDRETRDAPGPAPPFRLDGWLVQPSLNRLTRGDDAVQLEPRIMQVLVHLARRPGEVLTRQFLFDAVWPGSVVCEEALTRTISELRRIFGDDPRSPRVIETIRGSGYRLAAPIGPATPTGTAAATGAEAARRRWPLRAVGTAAVVLLAAVLLRGLMPARDARGWRFHPLTAYPGVENTPALSPDGTMLAFAWRGEGGAEPNYDLYVMRVEGESPVRLTEEPGHALYPSWSPDGSTIAFVSGAADSYRIRTVSVLGGEPRTLLHVGPEPAGLDWSPDGERLVYASRAVAGAGYRLHLLELATLVSRPLDVGGREGGDDITPAFSPDGRRVAFVRVQESGMHEVLVAPLDGGRVETLDGVKSRVSGLDWVSDSKLVLAAAHLVDFDLWIADLGTGERTWLTTPGRPAIFPSAARGGERLIYGELAYDCHIWHVDITPAGEATPGTKPLVASTRMDYNPVLSPDGRRLAFISDRTGLSELWVADADGGRQRRLTHEIGPYLMRPCWAADGRRIAYSVLAEGHLGIFVTDVETGVATRLSDAPRHELLMHWSASGEWLYYRTQRGVGWEVRRRRADGGVDERVAATGYTIVDALEGGALLCRKDGDAGLWRLPAGGGEAQPLVPGEVAGRWLGVAAVADGLYFLREGEGSATCGFYDLATGRSDSLAAVAPNSGMLRVSPDGRRLVYDCTQRFEVDLILAEAP